MLFNKYFIMLRNINQLKLCNGTRLSVKKLMTNIIEAKILTGLFKGEDALTREFLWFQQI